MLNAEIIFLDAFKYKFYFLTRMRSFLIKMNTLHFFNLKYWFPDLSKRSKLPELMDRPDSDSDKLFKTLDHFEAINILFSRTRNLLRLILKDCIDNHLTSITILDIGSGGGDNALWLAKQCRKLQIKPTIICLDHDPRVVRYAQRKCRNEPSIHIREGSAFDIGRLPESIDYIFANHFLHHLESEYIPSILHLIASQASRGFVIGDLIRSNFWFLAYTIAGVLAWRNAFTFYDGRLSICKGFTRRDLENYLRESRIAARLTIRKSLFGHWHIWSFRK